MKKNKISVSEALKKLESGESISEYVIDFESIKVESLDVMKLAKGGVIVPEEAIYYDDEDIADDEAFAGDWERIETDPVDELKVQAEVKITLNKEVK